MSVRTLATTQTRSTAPPPGAILQRKCACGTHATGGVCDECKKHGALQRKLAIGASSDPLEHEADRAADRAVGAAPSPASAPRQQVQRFGETPAHGGSVPPSVENALAHPGIPLRPELRTDMEQRFGFDFTKVRVHTDDVAARSASEVSANAYTVGHHIVFARGRFAPESRDGRWLLAHELAHVVQQGAASASPAAEPFSRAPPAPAREMTSGPPRLSSSPQNVLRRSVAGCQELLDNPGPPVPPAAGTFIHAAVLAVFMATVRGALRISIPGAAANPQRTGGGKTVKPEVGGGASPQAGKGTPDLAALNEGGVLQVAELKPANVNQLLEGETQVARYIDQGNAQDEPQRAWRAARGIKVVSPMQPQKFPIPSLFFPTPTNIIEVVLRWCQSGVLGYALRAHRRPDQQQKRERRRIPDTERKPDTVPQVVPNPQPLPQPGPTPIPAPGPSAAPAPIPGKPAPAPDDGGKVIPFPGRAPDQKPEEVPVAAKTAAEAILDFIEGIIISGENIDQAVRRFLTQNPNILRNVEVAVAAIVAGSIISDILSGGAAVAKDPVVAAILSAMLRIAQLIRAAAPAL